MSIGDVSKVVHVGCGRWRLCGMIAVVVVDVVWLWLDGMMDRVNRVISK